MEMSLPTGSDLFNQVWNTTYKIISGNVLDPRSRGSIWMFADYPEIQDGKLDEHPGFPIITLDNFQTNTENLTLGIGSTYNDLTSIITIHANNRRHIDVLSSAIWDAFNLSRDVLGASGLTHLALRPGTTETIVFDRDNKIHTKTTGINFKATI